MALPVTRGASVALYPYTLTISFDTDVKEFQNAVQQRSALREGLVLFELNYAAFTQAQKNTWKSAFTSAKGRFTTNLSITIGSTTYSNLALMDDEQAWAESETKRYDQQKIRLQQTLTGQFTPGTSGTNFPTLANGTMGVLPYVQKKRFSTIQNVMAAGQVYGFAEYAGGLSGFPTDGLMSWELQEKMLSDADLATRINHFIANWGRLYAFTFTDEDSTAYPTAHYAMDQLVVNYISPNNSNVSISLEATN